MVFALIFTELVAQGEGGAIAHNAQSLRRQ